MGRRIIAIFAAAVIALIGVASVLLYARGADARAVESQQPVVVYVAKDKVAAGTVLKDALRKGVIVKTKVAAAGRPVGALTTVDDSNSSLLAITDVQAGEYILAARFGTQPAGVKAIEVPAGMVAMSVQLTDPARVGAFVTPGSHIAIYDSFKIRSLGTDAKAKAINDADVKGTTLLLGDVLVIGMGQTALTPGNTGAATADKAEGSASSAGAPQFLVTVALSPADAVRLVHGINNGTLYAGLMGSDLTRQQLESAPLITDLNVVNLTGALK
jgi:pilus assembly protein CpaB